MAEHTDTSTNTPEEIVYYDQRSVTLRTTQSICLLQEHDKSAMLELILKSYSQKQVIIVVKSKKKADTLSALLISKGLNATAVHGNHRQTQQQESAKKFNLSEIHIIITTDMILKTLALENIALVLSHDLPEMAQGYYDRVALMKELGVAIALVSPEDEPLLSDIEHNMKAEIEEQAVEGFVATPAPTANKKNKSKKPRHKKSRGNKE